jgi:capsular exopolysaccharide synthesis family protein
MITDAVTRAEPGAIVLPSAATAGRDLLGELPLAEQLVSFVAPGSFAADQYRSLRHIVEQMRKETDLRVLAVTSPTPGDGKTVTTLNLAGALAQAAGARVLVIDADLRRPSITGYLPCGRGRMSGLVDAIVDADVTLSQVVRRFDSLNLSVLPAGIADTSTYELLTSPRLEALLTEARAHYDYVLIDTPPLVLVPDSRLIGRWVDGFLIVVAAHKTPRRLLAEGLNLLDPAKVLGVVFNFDNRPLGGYGGYYGYGYGGSARHGGRGSWWRRVLGIGA